MFILVKVNMHVFFFLLACLPVSTAKTELN